MAAPVQDLSGKVAVVTGATSGIGLEVAAQLAARGAKVVFAVRNMKKADGVIAEIKLRHPSADIDPGIAVDFLQLSSIRAYADWLLAKSWDIHILVSNAGAAHLPRGYTPEGATLLAQSNLLGPYALVRLLERRLVASRARVVTVGSISHRSTGIPSVRAFLTQHLHSLYQHTKLAGVVLAFETQRRLGPAGVTCCAVDPGGVATAIWSSTVFRSFPFKQLIEAVYMPAEEAAGAVVHAATVDWQADRQPPYLPPEADFRYYARGAFAWPSITYYDTSGQDRRAWLAWPAFATWLALHTFVDYPLRWLSGGRLASKVGAVPANSQAYDLALGRQLWEECAAMAGLPAEVQLGEAAGAEVAAEPPAGKPSKRRRSGRQSRT